MSLHRQFEVERIYLGLQIAPTMTNRSFYFITSLVLLVHLNHEGAAFQNAPASCLSNRRSRTAALSAAALSPEEERAAALSDYLAKSHIEKMRAIQDVEMKKNSEIEQLKQQIAALKESSTETTPSSSMLMVNGSDNVKSLEEMSKEELVNKITQYQNFMRQYMIDAQEQKYHAVKAAEEAARKKLAESMTLLGLSATTETTTTASLPPLFAARNAAVSKAAAAGKSRWGPLEVQRASSAVSFTTTNLAPASSSTPLYAARNAAVTKAAAAGQSRWGSAEVQRAAGLSNGAANLNTAAPTTMSVNGGSAPVLKRATPTPTTSIPVPPEVAEADHGLRSDGSIGGLSLAERVYFGAGAASVPTPPEVQAADHGWRSDGSIDGPTLAERVFYGAASPSTPSTAADPREALFARRNAKVLQAAHAGRSRWGSQEIERVARIVAVTPPLPAAAVEIPPAPSPRVNFGAAILGRQ
jgi:hypothetical protein